MRLSRSRHGPKRFGSATVNPSQTKVVSRQGLTERIAFKVSQIQPFEDRLRNHADDPGDDEQLMWSGLRYADSVYRFDEKRNRAREVGAPFHSSPCPPLDNNHLSTALGGDLMPSLFRTCTLRKLGRLRAVQGISDARRRSFRTSERLGRNGIIGIIGIMMTSGLPRAGTKVGSGLPTPDTFSHFISIMGASGRVRLVDDRTADAPRKRLCRCW